MFRSNMVVGGLSTLVLFTQISVAGEPRSEPAQILAAFSEKWADDAWIPKGEGLFSRFIRPADDEGWQLRMKSLQALVAAGHKSVEPLLTALRDGGAAERILAAQALGFLGAPGARERLLHAAQGDADPAVRLYAVDSLGMLGGADIERELAALEQAEKNNDVKRHIAYARERKQQGIEPAVVEGLVQWNAAKINSAKLGEEAPDFELTAISGETIRLSDFRGKQPIVLVFIYGDT